MKYREAKRKDTEAIWHLVRDTVKTNYPDYYRQEVVDFFVSCIVKKI